MAGSRATEEGCSRGNASNPTPRCYTGRGERGDEGVRKRGSRVTGSLKRVERSMLDPK